MIKKLSILLMIISMMICLFGCSSVVVNPWVTEEPKCTYSCKYKTLNSHTKVTTTFKGNEITIVGDGTGFLRPPLTVVDSNNNILVDTKNTYGLYEKGYGIYIDNKFEINVCGDATSEERGYTLKNSNGNSLGYADFSFFSEKGIIEDVKGNLIATYFSPSYTDDYTVAIYDNSTFSDLTILTIITLFVAEFLYLGI